jgi:hypothetical protein
MQPIPKHILYVIKNSKTGKIYSFFLKNWASLFISNLLFFSLNSIKVKLYFNVPEMSQFNPKTSIRKYPIFCSWYNFFSANVSDSLNVFHC